MLRAPGIGQKTPCQRSLPAMLTVDRNFCSILCIQTCSNYASSAKRRFRSIPNSALLSNKVMNYNLSARDLCRALILQTTITLGNDAISYQLNAYTANPSDMVLIYSELHQHIQDHCAANGIEILSPTYAAVRDGSASTIPG